MTRSLIIAEGTAEQAILEILLKYDYLIVTIDDLISDSPVIPKLLKGQDLAGRYLQRDFGMGIDLIVVLDSLKRQIKVPFAYKNQINKIYYYVTRPEIEAIQLYANEDWIKQYAIYQRHQGSGDQKLLKPSAFFRANPNVGGLGIRNVKSYDFVYNLWIKQPDKLVEAIKHVQRDMQKKVTLGSRRPLADLLRADLRYL